MPRRASVDVGSDHQQIVTCRVLDDARQSHGVWLAALDRDAQPLEVRRVFDGTADRPIVARLGHDAVVLATERREGGSSTIQVAVLSFPGLELLAPVQAVSLDGDDARRPHLAVREVESLVHHVLLSYETPATPDLEGRVRVLRLRWLGPLGAAP